MVGWPVSDCRADRPVPGCCLEDHPVLGWVPWMRTVPGNLRYGGVAVAADVAVNGAGVDDQVSFLCPRAAAQSRSVVAGWRRVRRTSPDRTLVALRGGDTRLGGLIR